jgi:hypothetical protein
MISNGTDQQIIGQGDKRLADKNTLRKIVGTNYLTVSYPLMRKIGPYVATFLSYLIHLEKHNDNINRTDPDGYFMAKREFIEGQIGLTRKQQVVICNELIKLNLITCIRKGHGGIGYVKLHHAMIILTMGKSTFDDSDPL